jgi:hypothetical protein
MLLAVALFASVWVAPDESWIGGSGDPHLFIWYLGWVPHRLSLGQNLLITNHLSYPPGVNLMWNTSMVFPAVVLWPVTAAFGPVVSYNVLMSAALALSAWLGFVAARRFIDQPLACVLAGVLYGFGPGMLAQTAGHPQTTVALFPPIALILADEILVRQRLRATVAGALAGIAAALQLLTGEELLAVTMVVALVGVVLLALLHRDRVAEKAPYALRAVGAALLVGGALAAYPLAVQFFGPQRVFGGVQPPDVYVSDLLAFVVPGHELLQPDFATNLARQFTGNVAENDAYLGLPLILLFAAGAIVCRRRPVLRWTALTTLAVAVLSLGPHLHVGGRNTGLPLPWAAVAHLPLLGNALPSRLMTIAMLGVGIVVAGMWAERATMTRTWRVAVAALTVAALAAILPALQYPSHPAELPAFFEPGGAVSTFPDGAVVLITPFSSKESTDAMYWQAESGYRFRMPEGDAFTPGPYLGPHPTYLKSALDQLNRGGTADVSDQSLAMARADLAALGVQAVVAGPSRGQPEIVRFLTAVLGVPPVKTGGVDVWWSV